MICNCHLISVGMFTYFLFNVCVLCQGIIVDTNEGSTITVQIMPGYGKPVNWRKMMFFDPEGNAFPLYQVRFKAWGSMSTMTDKSAAPLPTHLEYSTSCIKRDDSVIDSAL